MAAALPFQACDYVGVISWNQFVQSMGQNVGHVWYYTLYFQLLLRLRYVNVLAFLLLF